MPQDPHGHDSLQATPLRIALVSSFTFKHFEKTLKEHCAAADISVDIYSSPYGQYMSELLDADSDLYRFDPNLVIVFIDTQSLLGEVFFHPYDVSDDARRSLMREKEEWIHGLLEQLAERTSATILLHNFEVPHYSPVGILEHKQPFGFIESIEELNRNIRDAYKSNNRMFVLDYNAFASSVGKRRLADPKMYYLADMKLDTRFFEELARLYMGVIRPLAARTRKCLVLDLDHTLWGGVVGEDGLEGIALGPTPDGRPFLEFQKYILNLYRQGVILAINSKNNIEDVLPVLRDHPHMVLREEHFAAMRVNWQDKATNIRELAEELNIGLDSMLFIDDDASNRALVRQALPEVGVLELPEDPALYIHTLTHVSDFNRLQMTSEDRMRGALYAAERQRAEAKRASVDLESFLESLQMQVSVLACDAFTKPRIAQLTQKTNQFNATTKRYTQDDIERMLQSGCYTVTCFHAKDRFGDYGIIGLYIVEREAEVWSIDTFLMSCRVIGKGVEYAMMAHLIDAATSANMKQILGTYLQTKKNVPMKDFFRTCGFLPDDSDDDSRWRFNIEEQQYPHKDKQKLLSDL